MMDHKISRGVLVTLLAAVAVFDVAQGILVLTGVCAPPANYQGTLLGSATIPMLVTAIVVGGSSLFAVVAVLERYRWSTYFAATTGVVVIAWELAQLAIVHQFSSVFGAIGLAVIAFAEYLRATRPYNQQRAADEHNVTRIWLVAVEAFVGLSSISGGTALLRGELDQFVSVDWLAGTPFADYTIPALVLVIVVGGSALLAAATAFVHREWAVLVSVVAGLSMAGYEVVEIACIDSKVGSGLPTALSLQLLYLASGLVIFGRSPRSPRRG